MRPETNADGPEQMPVRNLRSGIDEGAVLGETTHQTQTSRLPSSRRGGRGRPLEGESGRQRLSRGSAPGESSEIEEQLAPAQPVTELAAVREISPHER